MSLILINISSPQRHDQMIFKQLYFANHLSSNFKRDKRLKINMDFVHPLRKKKKLINFFQINYLHAFSNVLNVLGQNEIIKW